MLSLTVVGAAHARFILAVPGPGTPLQDAIDSAENGDVVVGQTGAVFTESVVISRRVGLSFVTIDATCDFPTAVAVTADGVRIQYTTIRGGSVASLDVVGADRVTVRSSHIENTCMQSQYGVRVIAATRVRLTTTRVGTVGLPYQTAGVWLSDLPPDARVKLERSTGVDRSAGIGILVENAGPNALVIKNSNSSGHAYQGILLRNVDGCRFIDIGVDRNGMTTGAAGIEFDAASEDNLIAHGAFGDNGIDVLDFGTDNCWRSNIYYTGFVPPC
jgi:nitrous oxidase accessory protein NosD